MNQRLENVFVSNLKLSLEKHSDLKIKLFERKIRILIIKNTLLVWLRLEIEFKSQVQILTT